MIGQKQTIVRYSKQLSAILVLLFLGFTKLTAQTEEVPKEPPPLLMFRAEEQYSYLKVAEDSPYESAFGDKLRYVSITGNKKVYFTFGGQYRARVESFTNKNWTDESENFYSQRLAVHSNLQLGSRLRLFGELYHGLTSIGDQIPEDDLVDLHQGFLEVTPWKTEKNSLIIRAGRQELNLGASRLVGFREGPNIRRSFDLAKISVNLNQNLIQLLYGKEVNQVAEAFDNTSNIFENKEEAINPTLWGVYTQYPELLKNGTIEAYYLGFHSPFATYNDESGEEFRHSIGLRSKGNVGSFGYNTEFIYQFGEVGNATVSAYDIETDWTYKFSSLKCTPLLGIRLDFSSGDREAADDRVGTFNPLFVNPAIYSLAAVNTPSNLTSFHPNITFYPSENLSIYLDYAFFFRTQENDGFYSPPRFLTRPAEDIADRRIGDVVGLQIEYEINRNISADLRSSYFIRGSFIEATGGTKNTFYIAPTLSFKI